MKIRKALFATDVSKRSEAARLRAMARAVQASNVGRAPRASMAASTPMPFVRSRIASTGSTSLRSTTSSAA